MTQNAPRGGANSTFLRFTADELEIQSAAADSLSRIVPLQRLHKPASADLAPEARRELGELGWFSLCIPEASGGSGLTAVEHALFFREAGRECAPLDILTQCLAVLIAVEHAELRTAFAAAGEEIALALRDGDAFRLLGRPQARFAIRVEREVAELYEIADLDVSLRESLDPATTMALAVALPRKAVISVAGPRVWYMAQLGAAAMLVGIAERAISAIVEYAKVRETFGRKIGSYQAVRHPCADMELRAEAGRSQLWYAAASLKEQRSDVAAQLDAAKHMANEAALANADVNIQLHGGIGITDEHDAHLLLKRTLLLGRTFGSKRTLLPRLLHAELQD